MKTGMSYPHPKAAPVRFFNRKASEWSSIKIQRNSTRSWTRRVKTMENQVLVSRLVGRTAPSGQKLWSLETRLVPEKPSIAPRAFRSRSDLVHLCRSQERPILSIFCRLERISRERGPRSIARKSRITVLGLLVAMSAFLRIAGTLYLRFYDALTHRTAKRLSLRRETHTASNLSEILDVLVGPKNSLVQSQESRESHAKPSQNS